jgi:Kef-type K+ transport system membrane component KefB
VIGVTLSTFQVSLLLTTMALTVLGAHAMGYLFVRLRQPAVVGEILAGLVLGPTLLGLVAPRVEATLFPGTGVVPMAMGALGEMGLLLLMFVAGGEMRIQATEGQRRAVASVAVTGLVVPFAVGILVVRALDHRDLSGPSGTAATTALVFGIAVAVTSIPVISRIMLDLGLLHTGFARLVLSVAAIEDVVLYGVLAVVLSLAHSSKSDDYGLWTLVGSTDTASTVGYHLVVTLLFFGGCLRWGTAIVGWLLRSRANVVERRSPAGFRLALLLLTVLVCAVLGINPVFGALLIGLAVQRTTDRLAGAEAGRPPVGGIGQAARARQAWEVIRHFSLAFFVPIYFVTVGLRLDLIRSFDPLFFAWFFLLCCGLKLASTWCGARLAGMRATPSLDLAVALNARGGPGIVLATVTLGAGVINEAFFTSVVLLSVLTSQMAGFWLDTRLAKVIAGDGAGPPAGAFSAPPVTAEDVAGTRSS